MREKREQLDGIEYILTSGNAVSTFDLLKRAASLLKGVDLSSVDGGGEMIGGLLGNLSSPIVKEVQDFVYSNINVVLADGKMFRLKDKLDEHFNNHPEHMITLLVKGVKFQFLPFFTSLKPIMGQIKG